MITAPQNNISQIKQRPQARMGGRGKEKQMKPINMEEFAGGAFSAQINRELRKATENIQDPNTDATAKRRITVVIEFKPNEGRDFVTTGVQAEYRQSQHLLRLLARLQR